MLPNPRDLAAGLIFAFCGIGFAASAFWGLDLGTSRRMGPGYFPLLAALILLVIGVAVCAKAFRPTTETSGPVAWRGLFAISVAVMTFALSFAVLGFLPALVLLIGISTTASGHSTLIGAVALTLVLTIFCVAIFSFGLGMPIRLIGPLFTE